MIIAAYIGNHKTDTLFTRLGWFFTRIVQRGQYSQVTHVEAIHKNFGSGRVEISSCSLRDGGVRSKIVKLNSENWRIFDMPTWDVQKSIQLLENTQGEKYDISGAIGTGVPFLKSSNNKWFCNEWVSSPWLIDADTYGPSQFISTIVSFGATEITKKFFENE